MSSELGWAETVERVLDTSRQERTAAEREQWNQKKTTKSSRSFIKGRGSTWKEEEIAVDALSYRQRAYS